MPAMYNHHNASKIALQLTTSALEHSLIPHSNDIKDNAADVVAYFNAIFEALYDPELDKVKT